MRWFVLLLGIIGLTFLGCSRTGTEENLDVNPPQVMITYPGDFETLTTREFTVRVTAMDNRKVSKVILLVNGQPADSTFDAPYSFPLQVDSTRNQVTLLAKAVDENNNAAFSQLITVYFPDLSDTEPPRVAILFPADWSEFVGDTLTVKIQASDNQGIRQVTGFFNGDSLQTLTHAPYLWSIPVDQYSGNATLRVRARDWAGNQSYSSTVTVTINPPDVTPPEVQILHPADWQTVSGTFPIQLAVTDDRGIDSVEVWWSGTRIATLTNPPYEINLNSTQYANGNYSLMARATDTSGNQSDSRVITVVVNN